MTPRRPLFFGVALGCGLVIGAALGDAATQAIAQLWRTHVQRIAPPSFPPRLHRA